MIGRTNAGGGGKLKVITGTFKTTGGNSNSFNVSGLSAVPKFVIVRKTGGYTSQYGHVFNGGAWGFINNVCYTGFAIDEESTIISVCTMSAQVNENVLTLTLNAPQNYWFAVYYTDSDGDRIQGYGTFQYYVFY